MSTPRYYPPGLSRTDPLVRLYDLFYQQQKDTSDFQAKLEEALKEASSGKPVVPSGGSSNITAITDITLSAASTEIDTPTSGAWWVVVLRQDAIGGRAITWGPGVSGASLAIDTTASKISVFLFAFDKFSNLWVMVGQLTTGMDNLTTASNVQPILTGPGYVKFPENAVPANISASAGALRLVAGGSNQNITATPSGTGIFQVNGISQANTGFKVASALGGSGTDPVGNIFNGGIVTTVGGGGLSTPGAIPYVTVAGSLGQDAANLFWDAVNHFLGLRTNSPQYPLDVNSVGRARNFFIAKDTGNNGSLSLTTGDASQSGYLQWRLPSIDGVLGTRLGYMGYDTTNVTLTLENSAKFVVAGGNAGFGGNASPGYAVDATGDVNVSGVFRKGGTAGASGTDPVGNVFSGGIVTTVGSSGASSGFPGSYASVTLTGQTSSVGATNIQHGGAALPAGRYIFMISSIFTATGTNNFTLVLNWNDGTAAESMQLGPQVMSSSPNRLTQMQYAITNGTNLTYTITISGGAGGTASVWIDVLRIA